MRFSSASIDTLATHAGRDGFAELALHGMSPWLSGYRRDLPNAR